jgi:hypothetical protein
MQLLSTIADEAVAVPAKRGAQPPWILLACSVWTLLVAIALGRAALHHSSGHIGCFEVFADAGRHWVAGESLYDAGNPNYLALFRYSPLVAALLAPLSWVSGPIGNGLLRLVNLAVLLPGLWWWAGAALPRSLTTKHMAVFYLLVALLSISPLVDIQVNNLTLGLMLITMAAVAGGRWNLAAAAVSLAVLIKAYPIALALVLVVLFPRRFALRWLGAMAFLLALPFALQRPAYVLEQYQDWISCMVHQPHPDGFFQDMMLFAHLWLAPISRQTYHWIELGSGAIIALILLLHQRRGMPRQSLLNAAFGLCCAWMMALGPATETTTYIMIAPVAAAAMLLAYVLPQPLWARMFVTVAFVILAGAQLQLLVNIDRPLHRVAAQPLAVLLLMVPLALRGFGDSACPIQAGPSSEPSPSELEPSIFTSTFGS